MSVDYRPSTLPPTGFMDNMSLKTEEADCSSRRPTLPALSTAPFNKYTQTPGYSTLPPPQRPSINSSVVPSVAFMTSSASSRKHASEERSGQSAPAHQAHCGLSLPSISEALGSEPAHVPSSATSINSPYPNTSPKSPNFTWKPTPSDSYRTGHAQATPHQSARAPYIGRIEPATPALHPAYPTGLYTTRDAVEPQNHRPVEPQPYTNGAASPHQPNRHRTSQSWPPPIPNQYDTYSHPTEQPLHSYAYPQPQSHAIYPPPPPPAALASTNPNFPSHGHYNIRSEHPPDWPNDEAEFSVSEAAKTHRGSYGEQVKRHLDDFDLESSLENIANSSKQVFDFSRHYSQRAHQTHRSGPLPGATPNLLEIDDMVKHGHEIQESLARLRDVIASQQAALAARSKDHYISKSVKHPASDDGSVYQDGPRDPSTGSENKKRRGRAAPPGRCHSCNRAETPEWRRGPDGARTLCNACGLHYAKLTRKMGANKVPIGSSNLGLKQVSPDSPSM